MVKEEFIQKMSVLRAEKDKLEQEYIESNAVFEAGQKVRVPKKNRDVFGIVKFNVVEYDDVVPFILLIKKDGEETNRRIHVKPGEEIEVVG